MDPNININTLSDGSGLSDSYINEAIARNKNQKLINLVLDLDSTLIFSRAYDYRLNHLLDNN